ncbi:MAG: TatD family hydrolase [Candidatus Eremiobacteraeota bacterium]|nr:TatD family hydrolase [Candidatus Eremiobacteraeota bacterium]
MIDTHAHVHDPQFDADRATVFARARENGIDHVVNVGCDLADSERALDVARNYNCSASVGIHPHEAKDAPDDLARAFAPFLRDPRIVAIGETGLDYYYDHSPRDAQQRVLRAQLRIAHEASMPVIFHHRDAYDDFIAILREAFMPGMHGVIHCFTGDEAQAHTFVEEFGLLLGIGGVVTFKSSQALRTAVKSVGVAPLVLETDCPYLAPVPHRGTRNEPSFATLTAARLASLLDVPESEVARVTDANARRLFPKLFV